MFVYLLSKKVGFSFCLLAFAISTLQYLYELWSMHRVGSSVLFTH